MAKRHIRMKEFQPGVDTLQVPTDLYLEGTDGSLGKGPFRTRADDQGFLINGNDVDDSLPKIAFMGDSFVESMFCPEPERFVSAVERALDIDGQKFRCLNAGYSGSNALQMFTMFLNKIYPTVGPGGVVVNFGTHSDADSLFVDGAYWNNNRVSANILFSKTPGNPDIPKGKTSHEAVLRSMIQTAQNLGVKLILATTPHRIAPFEDDAMLRKRFRDSIHRYNRFMARREQSDATIRRIAEQTGTPLIDCEAVLAGDPKYFYDELHLNSAGQKRMAEVVTELLGDRLSL